MRLAIPIQQKIIPKELGVRFKDGRIKFLTENAAKEYAKNRVVAPLLGNKPWERMVLRQGFIILGEADGNEKECRINIDLSHKARGIEIIHGHPRNIDGSTMSPISFQDFFAIHDNKALQAVTAYNEKGEYSTLEKLPYRKFPMNIVDFFKGRVPRLDVFKAGLRFMQQQSNIKEEQSANNFWTQHAKDFGYKYFSNMR